MKSAIAAAVTLALAGCTTIAPPYTAEVPDAERYAAGSLTCRTGALGLGSPKLAEVEIDRRAGTARLKRPEGEARLARGARVTFRDKVLNCRWDGDPPYRLSSFPAQGF
jgi:hypothetical protein